MTRVALNSVQTQTAHIMTKKWLLLQFGITLLAPFTPKREGIYSGSPVFIAVKPAQPRPFLLIIGRTQISIIKISMIGSIPVQATVKLVARCPYHIEFLKTDASDLHEIISISSIHLLQVLTSPKISPSMALNPTLEASIFPIISTSPSAVLPASLMVSPLMSSGVKVS